MNLFKAYLLSITMLTCVVVACSGGANADSKTQSQEKKTAVTMRHKAFNADNAYEHICRQLDFGPRVPGSEGHTACCHYLIKALEDAGVDTIIQQMATVTAFNGDRLPITNIIASINGEATRRVLLAAHWDTRPWADMEEDSNLRNQPIPGANDGASGVAVLLEIAHVLCADKPAVGVDILFTDAEDYGSNDNDGENSDSWCLGTQYWAEHIVPYTVDNMPVYGILLDMVGGRGARFFYEAFSILYAKTPTLKVWSEAARLGYGDFFPMAVGGAVTDDHVVLTNAGIPTVDIIELNNAETGSFPPSWHTHNDNLKNIDSATLRAVGETVLSVVYNEKNQ
ncbi:MAG: M28 family peptidase [Muribaculaceae bacterium]|nr:M28 family peptidase [Muribaculaceae bacterium]